jgi:hypothetical protein
LYDADDYAVNLFNCPTVAYSGEIDIQSRPLTSWPTRARGHAVDAHYRA